MPPKSLRASRAFAANLGLLPGLVLLTALTAVGPGCSSVAGAIRGDDVAAAWQGRTLAERRCASCHAVGARAQSPNASAPPFSAVSGRYSATALQRELEAISTVGHYKMPALALTPDERSALVAYMVSLKE